MPALADYSWLVSQDAIPWLDQASRQDANLATLIKQLRRHLTAAQTHLILEQVALRESAREKFSQVERMFFTRRGMEQATDQWIAAYKASRFPPQQPAADLCCGIGGDLAALVTRGPCTAVDADEVCTLFARHNCPEATVLHESARPSQVTDTAAWHIDPDRRSSGRRTTRIESFAPSLDDINALLAANPHAAIKLAPATRIPEPWRPHVESEWIGSRGECRQQVAWFGSLARHPGCHCATIVFSDGASPATFVGDPFQAIEVAASIGRYVYEPQATVIAARLSGSLAARYGLLAVERDIAYLTGDQALDEPLLSRFEVMEVLPFDRKRVKSLMRSRNISRLEVKKRGVDIDPLSLQKELHSTGEDCATLLITRHAGAVVAIVAQRPCTVPRTETL